LKIHSTALRFSFLVPLGGDNRAAHLAFANEHEFGVEITSFVAGDPLNLPDARAALEADLERELADFSGIKTFHGAFLDLALHSQDHDIASLSASRIERDVITASHLGCEKIVFHLGFNPLIPAARHRDDIVDSHAEFWGRMLVKHPGISICLENQWEADWTIFAELFETLRHPRLGMCLDVAHAHVHSHFSPAVWRQRMAPYILHMHWNDNGGDRDSHQPMGAGNIDWPEIFEACSSHPSTVTLEMNGIPALEQSLAFLARQGVRASTHEALL
jgi:sugar phosphate isomerase/epimerase